MQGKYYKAVSVMIIAVFLASPLAFSSTAATNNPTQQHAGSIIQAKQATPTYPMNPPFPSALTEEALGLTSTNDLTSPSNLLAAETSSTAPQSDTQTSDQFDDLSIDATDMTYWFDGEVPDPGSSHKYVPSYLMGCKQTCDWGGYGFSAEVYNTRSGANDASTTVRFAISAGVYDSLRASDDPSTGIYYLKYIKLEFERSLDSGPDYQSVVVYGTSSTNLKQQFTIPPEESRETFVVLTTAGAFLDCIVPIIPSALILAGEGIYYLASSAMAPGTNLISMAGTTEDARAIWTNPGLDYYNNPLDTSSDYSVKAGAAYCYIQWYTKYDVPEEAPWMMLVKATVGLGKYYWGTGMGYPETPVEEPSTTLNFKLTKDCTAPEISHPVDISYPVNSPLNRYVAWDVSDVSTENYQIEKQTGSDPPVVVSSDFWTDSVHCLSQDVSGLTTGTYTYTCTAWDRGERSSSDSVTVTVTASDPNTPTEYVTASPQHQEAYALYYDLYSSSISLYIRNNLQPDAQHYNWERVWKIYVSTSLPYPTGALFEAGGETYGVYSHEENNYQWQPSTGYVATAHVQLEAGGRIQYSLNLLYSEAVIGQTYDINVNIETGYLAPDGTFIQTHTFSKTPQVTIVPVPDTTPPTIDQPADVTYPYPTSEYSITWHPRDAQPVSKQITIDGTPQQSQSWDGGDVTVQVGGLALGEHTYTCKVTDAGDNQVSDTVKVIVVAPDPTPQTVYKLATGEPTCPYGESIQRGTVADTHVSDNLYEVVRCGSDGFFPYAMQCYYSFQFTEAPRSCVTNLAFSVEAKTDLYPNEWYLTVFVSLYNSATGSWNDIGSLTNIDTIIGGNLDINSYMDSSGNMRIYFWGYAFFAPFTVSVDNIYFAVTYVMS